MRTRGFHLPKAALNRLLLVVTVLGAFMAGSCTTLDYRGDVRAPSDKVDVLFALEDIEQPYTVMGRLTTRAQAGKTGVESMQRKMIRAALDRGADAIVYVSSEKVDVPNRDLGQEFRDPEDRPDFGPAPTDTVRTIEALLVCYGEDPVKMAP